MAQVVLENLSKRYPDKRGAAAVAVSDFNLSVAAGEFMVLVGPSGCGKSTTLRMIAGLEEASGGTIAIGGRVVNDLPSKDRDVAMVFQNYALYPHMTVYENLAFGLKLRRQPRAEIDARVREATAMLGLEELLERRPKALSGGQRQRVALGRAIVRRPRVFLFDEPLSNLDAKMRVAMRAEISRLHARLGATMIYVTHDQTEAMTMGDRICVMRAGRIEQVAAPLEVYERPANLFVAGFIGSPPMNFFRGTIASEAGGIRFVSADAGGAPLALVLPDTLARRAEHHSGREVVLGLRPENLAVDAPAEAGRTVEAKVELAEPMGAETHLHFGTGTASFVVRAPPSVRHRRGDTTTVSFDLARAHLFAADTGQALD